MALANAHYCNLRGGYLFITGTPGAGFGPAGKNCFRLTGFGSAEDTAEAIERLKTLRL